MDSSRPEFAGENPPSKCPRRISVKVLIGERPGNLKVRLNLARARARRTYVERGLELSHSHLCAYFPRVSVTDT